MVYARESASILRERPGAAAAVLLLHGYTGIPAELEGAADALHAAGLTVYAPRLPGHGTDRADFMATGARDWIRRAMDAYIDLAQRYGTVGIVGHSMGGALALIVAATFQPERIALLAPAVDIANPALPFAPLIRLVAPVVRQDAPPSPEDASGERLRLHEEYRSDQLVAQAAELWRVVRRARAAIPAVSSSILVVEGERDAAVPRAAGRRIQAGARNAKVVRNATIPEAGHLFPFVDPGRAECASLVKAWFTA